MTPVALLLLAAGVALLTGLWAIQERTRNAATADVGWTILVGGGALTLAVLTDDDPWRRTMVGGMAAVWAMRLTVHLVRDRVLGVREEDGRYRALRERWGASASRKFLLLYLAQGAIAALFLVPLAAAMRGGPLDGWAAAGLTLGALAVAGEWLADRQLARFRARPDTRGTVCREGLWRFSRHPNYFFEWLYWWAYVVITRGAPLTLLGPAVMLLFLFRFTGIPYTERQALKSRGEAYREYQRTTSVFIPWPPRRRAS